MNSAPRKWEDRLYGRLRNTGNLESFKEDYEGLFGKGNSSQRYAYTLKNMLFLAGEIEEGGIKVDGNAINDDYAVIGGFAVLSHICDKLGDGAVSSWRGTSDIDMLMPRRNFSRLSGQMERYDFGFKQYYVMRKDGAVGPIYCYKHEDPQQGLCSTLGLREGIALKNKEITKKILKKSQIGSLYGIGFRVVDKGTLIDLKMDADRDKDREDIRSLRRL